MSGRGVSPDPSEIRRALEVLHAPDAVIELRVIYKRKRIDAGYFGGENRERLIEAAVRLNQARRRRVRRYESARPATPRPVREPRTGVRAGDR